MTKDLVTFGSFIGDHFPRPGERIKQYVVDERKRAEWERETCPRVLVFEHNDNTGIRCRNGGGTPPWFSLDHDACAKCNDDAAFYRRVDPRIDQWLAELERHHADHPICADRSKLSDEVVPSLVLREPTMPGMLRGIR